jgi:hypothetical protein
MEILPSETLLITNFKRYWDIIKVMNNFMTMFHGEQCSSCGEMCLL